ncbi:MAG TPA: tryptophan 7-halogenase [Opitutaceae bacterium]|jgi:flavin-dependent dehydrogenase|nr:tryptophan 7-halogenase [Opitutaceae bacterium]
MEAVRQRWDVIVIGGALAGASAACLLLRSDPQRRILILERSLRHGRKVGESTVEVSAYFLGRVLGLTDHLLEKHLPKQGLRYWAMNAETSELADCSEIGPRYHVPLPGFQVDRAVLDEHLLAQAAAAGAEVRRGVKVRGVQLASGADQTVEWEENGAPQTGAARWVVDASGPAAVLGRQERWLRQNREHPIAACWSRWTGVKSWDERARGELHPQWAGRVPAGRNSATNHLTGYGWWAWWIPLKGGDVSIGVVYDQRLCELPPGPSPGARLRALLLTHPAARELLAEARLRDEDVHYRANLPYVCERLATDGAVLVGDAAGFLDPLYSPGMDWIAITVCGAVSLIDAAARGEDPAPLAARHNEAFVRGYWRWFRALYRDKYLYLGDHELMRVGFRLDVGLYYLGTVRQVFRRGAAALQIPAFTRPFAGPPAALMALYNRRLAAIARARRRRGAWGRRNAGRFAPFSSFTLGRGLGLQVAAALLAWLALELREGWRAAPGRPGPIPEARPAAAGVFGTAESIL